MISLPKKPLEILIVILLLLVIRSIVKHKLAQIHNERAAMQKKQALELSEKKKAPDLPNVKRRVNIRQSGSLRKIESQYPNKKEVAHSNYKSLAEAIEAMKCQVPFNSTK